MDAEHLEVLKEAVQSCMRKEDLDRAIGRVVRGRSLDFRVYVQIVSEIREVAYSRQIDMEAAARSILEQQKEGD